MTIVCLLVGLGLIVLGAFLLLLWACTGKRLRIDRWEGALMLAVFAAYYVYLFNKL